MTLHERQSRLKKAGLDLTSGFVQRTTTTLHRIIQWRGFANRWFVPATSGSKPSLWNIGEFFLPVTGSVSTTGGKSRHNLPSRKRIELCFFLYSFCVNQYCIVSALTTPVQASLQAHSSHPFLSMTRPWGQRDRHWTRGQVRSATHVVFGAPSDIVTLHLCPAGQTCNTRHASYITSPLSC